MKQLIYIKSAYNNIILVKVIVDMNLAYILRNVNLRFFSLSPSS